MKRAVRGAAAPLKRQFHRHPPTAGQARASQAVDLRVFQLKPADQRQHHARNARLAAIRPVRVEIDAAVRPEAGVAQHLARLQRLRMPRRQAHGTQQQQRVGGGCLLSVDSSGPSAIRTCSFSRRAPHPSDATRRCSRRIVRSAEPFRWRIACHRMAGSPSRSHSSTESFIRGTFYRSERTRLRPWL